MYFKSFPTIVYDSVGNGQIKDVKNLLRRVAIRSKVKSTAFDMYFLLPRAYKPMQIKSKVNKVKILPIWGSWSRTFPHFRVYRPLVEIDAFFK